MTHGRISREDLWSSLDCDAISLWRMAADPRVRGIDLRSCDTNGDGLLSQPHEQERLAELMDGLDGRRDGWITLTERSGRATPAAPVAQAIAEQERVAGDFRAQVEDAGPARMDRAVVVVGMSETAYAEAASLRRRTPVLLATDPRGGDEQGHPDVVRDAAGHTHDVRTRQGMHAFVATIGLPPDRAAAVEAALDAVPEGGRAELAQLAAIWAPAERGEEIPRRLLVSGHGNGTDVFGDDHDAFRMDDLLALARAMPRAAARIDAIQISACQYGYRPQMERVVAAFPRLRSIWGYAGFSSSGPAAHRQQAAWERATRAPGHGGQTVRRDLAAGTRRGENVAVWTRDRGWTGPAQRPMQASLDDAEGQRATYERYLHGELDVQDPRSGPVWQRYQRFQEVINHSDFRDQSPDFQRWARGEADQALRLRFFSPQVTRAFDRAYRRPIEAGYRALGMDAPRFEGMARREVLAEVERFRGALARREPPPQAARDLERLLVEGVVELRASRIPAQWL